MADTMRGDFPTTPCSDCGDKELGQVCFKHWGPLVQPGTVGFFGPNCWEARRQDSRMGREPRPLGTRSPAC